jgi:photosystem II stability/assembly factor-like uncharacterized protein
MQEKEASMIKIKLPIFLGALLILGVFPSPMFSQSWEPVGPSGGTFIGSVTDPADADTLTAITTYPSTSAAFRSYDGGDSWTKLADIPYSSLYHMCSYDFNRLYVVASSRCFYSVDGGSTWSYGTLPSSTGYGRVVDVDPNQADNVFIAGYKYNSGSYDFVFFKSTNGGQTWTGNAFFTYEYLSLYDIAVSKTNPDVIYVAGFKRVSGDYYGCLLQSTDGGASWSDISSLLETQTYRYMYSVAIDPTDENRVYVGGSYFYYTVDGGVTWMRDTSHYFYAYDIRINPNDPSNLYMGCNKDFYVSMDYGVNWTFYNDCVKGSCKHIHVAPADPSVVFYSASYAGFYKTETAGSAWASAHAGIYGHWIHSIETAASQPETVYLNNYNGYTLFASYDSGENWSETVYPSGCSGSIADILVCSQNTDIVFALEASG